MIVLKSVWKRLRDFGSGTDFLTIIITNKENMNVVEHQEVVEQCAQRDRDDIFDEESDVSSIEAEWDMWMNVPGD